MIADLALCTTQIGWDILDVLNHKSFDICKTKTP